jgi:mono/diheme cytochrome c family protein
LIAKGESLAGAGHCAVCHTRSGGLPFAGGLGLQTPFGIVYTPNITPDPDTGIGRWSLEAFTRAMHEGVSRDGSHLFPAFPSDHFTKISDDDVKALYAGYACLMALDGMPAGRRAQSAARDGKQPYSLVLPKRLAGAARCPKISG